MDEPRICWTGFDTAFFSSLTVYEKLENMKIFDLLWQRIQASTSVNQNDATA